MREQRQIQFVRRDAYSTCRQKITVINSVRVWAGVWACVRLLDRAWKMKNEKGERQI